MGCTRRLQFLLPSRISHRFMYVFLEKDNRIWANLCTYVSLHEFVESYQRSLLFWTLPTYLLWHIAFNSWLKITLLSLSKLVLLGGRLLTLGHAWPRHPNEGHLRSSSLGHNNHYHRIFLKGQQS